MNKALKAAIAGISGTTFMTTFSYLVSAAADENFSEPEHLGTMIDRLVPGISKKNNMIAGWAAHYTVGLLFALVYVELWEQGKIKHSVKNSLLLGTISGALAVVIWRATFKAHPSPPWVNYTRYFVQLVPAHVVFAVFTNLAYQFIRRQESH